MVEGSTRVYDWMMGPHRRAIEAQARRLGLPARGRLHECLSPLAQISQTVGRVRFPARAQLPPHFHHVGPLRPLARADAGARRSRRCRAIDPDRPFVFASLGTMQGGRFGLFERIARACRQVDVQLLLAHCGGLDARQEDALRAPAPTGSCDFAPQQAALARADAVISHAGWNTVMDAVAARTPMLALPIAFDHPGGAARVRHAGHRPAGLGAPGRRRARWRATCAACSTSRASAQRLQPLAAAVARAGGTRARGRHRRGGAAACAAPHRPRSRQAAPA